VFNEYSIYDLNRSLTQNETVQFNEMNMNFEELRAKYEDMIYLRGDPAGTTPFVTTYLNLPEVRDTLRIPKSVQAFEICNDPILDDYKSQI